MKSVLVTLLLACSASVASAQAPTVSFERPSSNWATINANGYAVRGMSAWAQAVYVMVWDYARGQWTDAGFAPMNGSQWHYYVAKSAITAGQYCWIQAIGWNATYGWYQWVGRGAYAAPGVPVVQPFYAVASDERPVPGLASGVDPLMQWRVHEWYRQKTGLMFRREPACIIDARDAFWLTTDVPASAAWRIRGHRESGPAGYDWPSNVICVVFFQGMGGWAGGDSRDGGATGFAVVSEAPVAVQTGYNFRGVYAGTINPYRHLPWADLPNIPNNMVLGSVPHELGHAFGLPHGGPGSIMSEHWLYPTVGLHPSEIAFLASTRWFSP